MPFEHSISFSLPHSIFYQAPLLRFALCFGMGVGFSWVVREAEYCLPILFSAALLCGLLLALALWRWRNARAVVVFGMLTIFFTGGSFGALEVTKLGVDWPSASRSWQGKIEQIYRVYDDGIGVEVSLTDSNPSLHGKRVRVKLQGGEQNLPCSIFDHHFARDNRTSSADSSFLPGHILFFTAAVNRGYKSGNPGDFDYPGYLTIHGISGAAYASAGHWKIHPVSDEAVSWRHRLLRFRRQLTDTYLQHFSTDAGGLLSALTLGDKTLLSAQVRSLFSDSGTSHVLALSGLHLGILFMLFHFLFLKRLRSKIGKTVGTVIVLLLLWSFVLLAGTPISLLRAVSMLTLLQVGQLVRANAQLSLNGLSFAALVLLIVNPLSLFDVSFQLSFAAVFSIILCNDYVWLRFPLPRYVEAGTYPYPAGSNRFSHVVQTLIKYVYHFVVQVVYPFFTISLSAQLGTFALVAIYFHTFSPYFFLANLVAIPGAYVLLTSSLCFFLFPLACIRAPLSAFMQWVIQLMIQGLDYITQWPGASLPVYVGWPSLLCITLLFPAVYFLLEPRCRHWRKYILCVVASLLAVSVWSELYRHRPHRLSAQIIIYNVPHTTVVHFIQTACDSYLYSSEPVDSVLPRLSRLQQNYFVPMHIEPLRWLTHDSESYEYLVRRGNAMLFGRRSMAVLERNIPLQPVGTRQPVDILLLSKGCYTAPEVVLQHYLPRYVVLSPSLSFRLRRSWEEHCRSVHQPFHDVAECGAFVWILSQIKPEASIIEP